MLNVVMSAIGTGKKNDKFIVLKFENRLGNSVPLEITVKYSCYLFALKPYYYTFAVVM